MLVSVTVIAVVAALTAAATFGTSSVLMFRAAQGAPRRDLLRLRLLAWLFRSPLWVAGATLQAASFVVQALALAFGPLALVQPLAATDLLFAFPFLARSRKRRMQRIEWLGGGLVVAGVAAFLAISPPRAGVDVPAVSAWVVALALVGGAVALAVGSALRASGTARTTLLAVAAAIDFGLLDALTKGAVGELRRQGFAATLLTWYPYALLAVGTVGLLLSQSAFQSGALQVSLSVIDTLEPTLAVLLGTIVFEESLARSPAVLAAQLAAGGIALAGIVILDRSPVVRIADRQSTGAVSSGRSTPAPGPSKCHHSPE